MSIDLKQFTTLISATMKSKAMKKKKPAKKKSVPLKRGNKKAPRLPRRGGRRPGWSPSPRPVHDDINLSFTRIGEGNHAPILNRWQIQDILAWGGTCMITAEPKAGKSWHLADMMVAIASGHKFLNYFEVHKTGPVLAYSPELKQAALEGRIAEICKRRDLDPTALNIYINDQYGVRLELIRHQEMIEQNVANIRPALLIFDPLSRCYGGGLNSEKGLHKMTEFLIRLSRKYECAVVIAHHSAKRTGSRHVFGGKGSGVLSAFGDSNISIIPTGKDKSEVETSQRNGSPISFYTRFDGEEGSRGVVVESQSEAQYKIRVGLIDRIVEYVTGNPNVCLTQIRENVDGKTLYFAGAVRDALKLKRMESDGNGGYFVPAVPSDTHFSGISEVIDTTKLQPENSVEPAPLLVETDVDVQIN